MADLNRLSDLHLQVRSQILEQIQASLSDKGGQVASTQYTKSDGTNYGMYQKADPNLVDLWDAVINQRSVIGNLQAPNVGPSVG